MKNGKIIILNGVSSAGKTTLAKTLQRRLNEPFLFLDCDTFIDTAVSNNYFDYYSVLFRREMPILHHVTKVLSDKGLNTILECTFTDIAFFEESVELLRDYPVLFVQVNCNRDELRRREIERGDRDIGFAEKLMSFLEPKESIYDIIVDTSNNSNEECVDMIINMLDNPEKFTAFKTLWSKRTK